MDPLNAIQVRVLGCLIEKALATPQQYPLSEASLLTACNQATNRFPVVEYEVNQLRPALIGLRDRKLAKRTRRPGERVEKHAHLVDDTLGLAPGPLAVLAILLLRGPQTSGELRSRTGRLARFGDVTEVEAALRDLADRGLAEELPRRPGEKQTRWRHLMSGQDAPIEIAEDAPAPARAGGTTSSGPPLPTLREALARIDALAARVSRLERELGLEDPADSSPDESPG